MSGKRTALFLASIAPNPLYEERMKVLELSGGWDTHLYYWERVGAANTIPQDSPFLRSRATAVRQRYSKRLVLRFVFLCCFAARVWRLRRRSAPNVIHAVQPDMLLVAGLLRLAFSGARLQYELHDLVVEPLRRYEKLICRIFGKHISTAFVTSPLYDSQYLKPRGLLPTEVSVQYLSNAPLDFPAPSTASSSRSGFVIGWLGTIRQTDRLLALLEAVQLCRQRRLDTCILLAGSGDVTPLLDQASFSSRALTYLGPYPHKNHFALFEQCDCVFAAYAPTMLNYRLHVARRFHEAVLGRKAVLVSQHTYMASLVEQCNLLGAAVGTDPEEMSCAIEQLAEKRASFDFSHYAALETEHRFESFAKVLLHAYRCPSIDQATADATELDPDSYIPWVESSKGR